MAAAKHDAQFPPGIHEALASLADGDVLVGLEGIVAALRPQRGLAPNAGIAALCHLLESYPAYRTALREVLRRYLGDGSAAGFYAENGILANTGFFTELGRRVVGKMLPPPRDDSLRGVIGILFDSGEHVAWLEETPAEDWRALYAALHLEEDTATRWQQPWLAMLDGLDMLSVRMAAIGVEPELMRHYRVPRDRHNPFLAQNTELQAWLIEARTALLEGDRPVPDTRQVDVLLDQCAKAADTVRRGARRAGASFGLTFLLQRLEQSLARMRTLLNLVETHDAAAAETADARMAFAVGLLADEGRSHEIRTHLRSNSELVALQVTEQASRTGEHYISSTRREYLAMLRAALGAGAIIGVMALIKVLIAQLHLPPLLEAIAFSLDYGIGFVLIFILHFTVATKQPAMTAQTVAASLTPAQGSRRRVDVDAVSLLVSRVARTQFIAIVGNVALAMPVALLATWLLVAGAGAQAPVDKASGLLTELHPWHSPALFHAAIAGVWLFVAGLVAGYVDNLAAYERVGDRVRRVRWLGRLLGIERRARFADWLALNIGGIAGNFFFGVMLGSTGFIGQILGLPLDIRHVAFASANLSIAVVGSDFAVPAGILAISFAGVLLIAAVNLAVSFSLALTVALRARGQRIEDSSRLVAAIARRFRQSPASFFVPSRDER
ncbi:MAG: site-specific recombinase [Gammaproteobacteria bacterium]